MTEMNSFLNQDTITTFGLSQYTRISIILENLKTTTTTTIIITESESMTNLICDNIPQFIISKNKIKTSREASIFSSCKFYKDVNS